MLCDQIIPHFQNDPSIPVVTQAYTAYGKKVEQAQRFVLNRDAVMTIHSISESSPKKFLQALKICRLPFPSMWVEFAFKDRYDWMQDGISRGMIVKAHDEASPPSRLGFLMEQIDEAGRIIHVIPCWTHPEHKMVSICHLALVINTNDGDFRIDEDFESQIRERLREKKDKVFHNWINDEEELEASFRLEARINETIPEIFENLWARIIKNAPQKDVTHLFDLARYDLMAEWRFTLALLTVLNSRNVIEIGEESDMSKINKVRARKNVAPLMSYREIKLNMSRIQKRRLGESYGHRNLQSHLVKGHWKLRSSGLYWWNPFVRGTIGTPPQTTTLVKG